MVRTFFLVTRWALWVCLLYLGSASSTHDQKSTTVGDEVDIPQWESQSPLQRATRPAKQVAIIGAGAGGASTAYHLKRFADEAGIAVDLTVLEQSDYIGGRSTTICAFANDTHLTDPCVPIELGASIFVEANDILFRAVKAFNLPLESSPVDQSHNRETTGIFDGQRFVFIWNSGGSDWKVWWSSARIVWRYGISPIRTLKLMRKTIRTFLRMYAEPVFPWRHGLTAAATDIGLLDTVSMTGRHFLGDNGVSERFAREIVQAGTRVNYAQNVASISGLITMVSLAGEGKAPSEN